MARNSLCIPFVSVMCNADLVRVVFRRTRCCCFSADVWIHGPAKVKMAAMECEEVICEMREYEEEMGEINHSTNMQLYQRIRRPCKLFRITRPAKLFQISAIRQRIIRNEAWADNTKVRKRLT